MSLLFRLVVSGDREWTDWSAVYTAFASVKIYYGNNIELIHGGCRGLDTIAGSVGASLGWAVRVFPAEWSIYGLAAGPIRNAAMLDTKPHFVLLFHNNIANSKGTAGMLKLCQKRQVAHKLLTSSAPVPW